MENQNTASRLALAIVDFNSLTRRTPKKGYTIPMARPLTADDFLTLQQARDITGKPLGGWSEDSVFIRVETVVDLYRSLTPKARKALAWDEMLGGWFDGGPADEDDCDEDGHFCSTPCHSDEVPSVADFAEDVAHCSESGVLFVY